MLYYALMKPSNPFVINGYRGPEYFCDRIQETNKVISALANERNITLMAPRRYGKTGLIRNVFNALPNDYASIYVDIYSTTNLQEFTQAFASSVIGALDNTVDKALSSIGRFFKAVRPTVTPDGTGGVSFSITVDKDAISSTLLGAFEYLASKDKHIVVAIDEFQQIMSYPEKGTEALLRSKIQFLDNVNFIFAGSRHHMMGEMFTSPRHPFYQSTDMMSLDVIPRNTYSAFAEHFFRKSDRAFSSEAFHALYDRFDGVTWYLQSVLNRIWGEGGSIGSEDDVNAAVASLVEDRALTFHDLFAAQSEVGKKLLRAIAHEGKVRELTAGEFIKRHSLTAPSSVRGALPVLENLDLIYQSPDGYMVYDYLFAEYLRQK